MTRENASPWAALCALCIGFFMIMLDTTIVNVAIPSMLTGLHASLNQIVWVNSVYLLTYAVPLLLTGRLGDRFGPKRLFLFGLVVFTGASLWCGLAGSADWLIVARAVQGLGAAAMTPQTMAFITHLFPPSKRGAPMGMWGAVAGVATIAGPLLGGLLVVSLGWQWIFFVNVPIGVVAIVATLIMVPDWQPRHSHRFDVPGILLSSVGLFALVFGVQNGQQYDWGTVVGPLTIPEIIGVGVLLLVAFVIWQRVNRNEPLMPLRVFQSRNFSSANLANVTIGFVMVGMFLPLTIWIQSVRGFTPLEAGLVTAPMSLLAGTVAPFAGRLSDRISGKWVVMTGFALLCAGLLLIATNLGPDLSPWMLIPAMLVAGAGIGCIFSPLANLAVNDLQPQLMGAGSGIFNTARQVGTVLGSATIGVLLQARLSVSLHNEAIAQSAQLPQGLRAQFVQGFSSGGGSATEFSTGGTPDLPPGVPAAVAAQIGRVATETFQHAFTSAAVGTMLLPAGAVLVGVLACLVMVKSRTPSDTQPPAERTPEVVGP